MDNVGDNVAEDTDGPAQCGCAHEVLTISTRVWPWYTFNYYYQGTFVMLATNPKPATPLPTLDISLDIEWIFLDIVWILSGYGLDICGYGLDIYGYGLDIEWIWFGYLWILWVSKISKLGFEKCL